jgi:hypothetical protein
LFYNKFYFPKQGVKSSKLRALCGKKTTEHTEKHGEIFEKEIDELVYKFI